MFRRFFDYQVLLMSTIRTVRAAIDVLGGYSEVASLAGVSYSAVSYWACQGRFPARTHIVLSQALRRRGYKAASGLWSGCHQARQEAS